MVIFKSTANVSSIPSAPSAWNVNSPLYAPGAMPVVLSRYQTLRFLSGPRS